MSELFLIAEIAGRTIAIATAQVEAAVDLGEVVAVPRTVPAVRGLAALRSRVVTVIDTALALGLPPMAAESCRAVTAQVDGHPYAFLVDALEDVAPFERQPLSAALALGEGWAAVGTALVERGGEPVLVVDLTALAPTTAALAA